MFLLFLNMEKEIEKWWDEKQPPPIPMWKLTPQERHHPNPYSQNNADILL